MEDAESMTGVREVFDGWARQGRADAMAESHAPAARAVFDRLPLAPDSWYLDVGCGNGYTVRWAAERCPAGHAVGLDASPTMIELASARSAGLPNVEFRTAAFPDSTLPDGRFTAVFSMETFYYLPDLHAALERVRRLLAPGGRFACVVDYYAENTASHPWRRELGVSMRLLSARGWSRAFAAAGLDVVEQGRLRLPAAEGRAEWKARQGSLFTVGLRGA